VRNVQTKNTLKINFRARQMTTSQLAKRTGPAIKRLLHANRKKYELFLLIWRLSSETPKTRHMRKNHSSLLRLCRSVAKAVHKRPCGILRATPFWVCLRPVPAWLPQFSFKSTRPYVILLLSYDRAKPQSVTKTLGNRSNTQFFVREFPCTSY
jgi:hypothetical protein